ncbi:MAG: GLPGLI family protein [Bacteroidia bacterium]|nr:GLPGLI family protein [Bacteroidia bacterium]
MKRNLFILLLILSGLKVSCQNDSCYHFQVEYLMQLNFNGPASYEAFLFFNKSQSLFEYKEIILENESTEIEKDTELNKKITIHDKSLYCIKNNREKNVTTELVRGFNKNEFYEVEETIPTIEWTITEETKKINEHNCSKATCNFRGRNYTVWFTTEIQTSFGPLKLNGLPGLILEASDDTKEVILYAKVAKQEDKRIVNKQSGPKIISRSDYKKIIAEGMKKFEETIKIISSRMDRGLKTSIQINPTKSIEMDLGL